jgi:hypothetical protein
MTDQPIPAHRDAMHPAADATAPPLVTANEPPPTLEVLLESTMLLWDEAPDPEHPEVRNFRVRANASVTHDMIAAWLRHCADHLDPEPPYVSVDPDEWVATKGGYSIARGMLRDAVGDHCPSHAEPDPTCLTCCALTFLGKEEE